MSDVRKDLPRIAEQIFRFAAESEEKLAWYIQPSSWKASDRAYICIDNKKFDVSIRRLMDCKSVSAVLEYLETEYAISTIGG